MFYFTCDYIIYIYEVCFYNHKFADLWLQSNIFFLMHKSRYSNGLVCDVTGQQESNVVEHKVGLRLISVWQNGGRSGAGLQGILIICCCRGADILLCTGSSDISIGRAVAALGGTGWPRFIADHLCCYTTIQGSI